MSVSHNKRVTLLVIGILLVFTVLMFLVVCDFCLVAKLPTVNGLVVSCVLVLLLWLFKDLLGL